MGNFGDQTSKNMMKNEFSKNEGQGNAEKRNVANSRGIQSCNIFRVIFPVFKIKFWVVALEMT